MKTTLKPLLLLACAAATGIVYADAELKTDQQKSSYAIGLQIGQSLNRGNVKPDMGALTQGMEDVLAGKQPRLSMEEMQAALEKQQEQAKKEREEQANKNKKAGQDFLAANKTKEGVKTLDSGIQYKVMTEGKGASPKGTDTVVVHYRGTLIDGKEFDSSYSRKEPAELPLQGVIKGWQEVLPKMKEGDKWQVFIPAELAYGDRGAGPIGPNSALIFEIELIKVKPAAEAKAPAAADIKATEAKKDGDEK